MPLNESALVVLVPEAEPLVKPFRDRYDPSAAAGVPAHITLLYPFKHPDEVDYAALEDLRRLFQRFAPFRFSLAPIRRFPDAYCIWPQSPMNHSANWSWRSGINTPKRHLTVANGPT